MVSMTHILIANDGVKATICKYGSIIENICYYAKVKDPYSVKFIANDNEIPGEENALFYKLCNDVYELYITKAKIVDNGWFRKNEVKVFEPVKLCTFTRYVFDNNFTLI